MTSSTACYTCNANWDLYINAETMAMLMTKESSDLLIETCVPMLKSMEEFGKAYLTLSMFKVFIDEAEGTWNLLSQI